MSNSRDEKTAEIMRQAQSAMQAAQRQIDAFDALLRSHGLDHDKLKQILEAQMSPEQRAQADALVRADLAAVEREVAEELSRRRFADPNRRSALQKRPRVLV